MHAVVLTFDRLALHLLGCYGSAWVETPHLDRLAAQSVVFENHFAENLDPAAESHAWWTGCCQFPSTPRPRGGSLRLAELLAQRGMAVHLIAEAGAQRPPLGSAGFDDVQEVGGDDGFDAGADEVPFARLVGAAVEQLARLPGEPERPWLLWLKSRGVPSPWLPPRDWATLYLDLDEADETGDALESDAHASAAAPEDAGDEGPLETAGANDGPVVDLSDEEFDALLRAVSSFGLDAALAAEATDTEWRLARQVYAGYVTLIDRWVGRLIDEIDRRFPDDPPLLIVTAAEGEPLGHRAGLPGNSTPLGAERARTPLIVRTVRGGLGNRRQQLVQTVDLPATLLDWFGIDAALLPSEGRSLLPLVREQAADGRPFVYLGDGEGTTSLHTPEHSLLRRAATASGHEASVQLFTQPDDHWEIHDVAAQSPEEAARLEAGLEQYIAAARESVSMPSREDF